MMTLHSTWSRRLALVAVALASALLEGPAAAQDAGGSSHVSAARVSNDAAPGGSRADLEALRAEVDALRQQVQALTALVRETRALSAAFEPSRVRDASVPMASSTDARPAHAAQAAQPASPAGVGANGASAEGRPPVRLTGTILSTSSFNSADANWIDAPNVVGTASGGSLTSSLRQSRFGVAVEPFAVGGWRASGLLEVDFFGGTPAVAAGAVMPLPRLLAASARFERRSRAIEVGHGPVIFAPRDPTSLAAQAFPQFFRAGNLFLRAPQVRVEQRVGGGWTAAAALVAPLAGDASPSYVFGTTPAAGERSQRPALEGRVGYVTSAADDRVGLQVGVSGHSGWIRELGRTVATAGVSVDGRVRLGRLGVTGEWFLTEDLDAFGAGVAQPGRAVGGWIEALVPLRPRLSVTAGAGTDRRPNGAGTAGRDRNTSAFGNVIVHLTPALESSVEYRWLQTRYVSGRDRVNHHVTAVMALRF